VEGVVNIFDAEFFRNRRIFLTGHTGFKGAWLCKILADVEAHVTCYSLPPETPCLFELICDHLRDKIDSRYGDIRDFEALSSAFRESSPEFVIHMAAQPIVRDGYRDPAYTFAVNVMGTVQILECTRLAGTVKSFLNVTTDKVYQNNEWPWGYRETDVLNGVDPYSNSKSCSELVTGSYRQSFFADGASALSTARAGNVIGGGDFATDRIIPDCFRAVTTGDTIVLRNPHAIRPFQHVLEPLFAYLTLLRSQYENPTAAGAYNIGPSDHDCVTVGRLADLFCAAWGQKAAWENISDGGPHEAGYLKLDCSKIKHKLGWQPRWNIETAVQKTVEWYQAYAADRDIISCMEEQIAEYSSLTQTGKDSDNIA